MPLLSATSIGFPLKWGRANATPPTNGSGTSSSRQLCPRLEFCNRPVQLAPLLHVDLHAQSDTPVDVGGSPTTRPPEAAVGATGAAGAASAALQLQPCSKYAGDHLSSRQYASSSRSDSREHQLPPPPPPPPPKRQLLSASPSRRRCRRGCCCCHAQAPTACGRSQTTQPLRRLLLLRSRRLHVPLRLNVLAAQRAPALKTAGHSLDVTARQPPPSPLPFMPPFPPLYSVLILLGAEFKRIVMPSSSSLMCCHVLATRQQQSTGPQHSPTPPPPHPPSPPSLPPVS